MPVSPDIAPIEVLVIDDSAIVASVVRRLLADEAGTMSVHTVGSVAEALAYLADHPVDVATLDLMLPDAEGAELVATIAAAGQCGVIVVSGNSGEHERALAIGATAVFGKSHLIEHRQHLIDAVHRAAARPRTPVAIPHEQRSPAA